MAGIERLNRASRAYAIALALVVTLPVPLSAHPMPDTEIVVGRDTGGMRLSLRIPVSDLQLALQAGSLNDDQKIDAGEMSLLRDYFARHLRIISATGSAIPVRFEKAELSSTRHGDVGEYRELELRFSAQARGDQLMLLEYDAVMHRVANHRAIVRDRDGSAIGQIRYSLAEKDTNRVELPTTRILPKASSAPEGEVQTFAERWSKAFWPIGLGIAIVTGLAIMAQTRWLR